MRSKPLEDHAWFDFAAQIPKERLVSSQNFVFFFQVPKFWELIHKAGARVHKSYYRKVLETQMQVFHIFCDPMSKRNTARSKKNVEVQKKGAKVQKTCIPAINIYNFKQ